MYVDGNANWGAAMPGYSIVILICSTKWATASWIFCAMFCSYVASQKGRPVVGAVLGALFGVFAVQRRMEQSTMFRAIALTLALTAATSALAGYLDDLPSRTPVERAAKQACRPDPSVGEAMCRRCYERQTACVVTLFRDVGDDYPKGMKFTATGGGPPDKVCQHGGDCIPISAVLFDRPCLITCDNEQYCGWERST